jgi:hypothetical protein
MKEYVKIQTVYKRDLATKHKTLIEGDYSLPVFEYLAGNVWEFTEKIDGTNIRVEFDAGVVAFGGRTDSAQIPAFLVKRLMELFPAEQIAAAFPNKKSRTQHTTQNQAAPCDICGGETYNVSHCLTPGCARYEKD